MPDSFANEPQILRGAFVEYGLSLPPLFVVFQFNPERISRSRNSHFAAPGTSAEQAAGEGRETRVARRWLTTRDFHQRQKDLTKLRDLQQADIQEESISFDIRLDATDGMNDGDLVATQFGVAPQLATLEQMMMPKQETLLGSLLTSKRGYSFTQKPKPPIILFIWGRKRVLPVNLTSMNISEEEFSTVLNPIRATVAVTLEVIEGPNLPYKYTQTMREAMTALNLADIPHAAKTLIPF